MPLDSTTTDAPPVNCREKRHSIFKRKTNPSCGCCGATIVIAGLDIIKKCVCDPSAEKCPMCVKARCHCKCGKTGEAAS